MAYPNKKTSILSFFKKLPAMNIIKHTYRYALFLWVIVTGLSACQEETAFVPDLSQYEKVDILISDGFTAPVMRTPGDPGVANPEGVNWNKLALLLVTSNPSKDQKTVNVVELTKPDFDKLPAYEGNFRSIQLDMLPGDLYIYGITYTAGAKGAKDLEEALDKIQQEASNVEAANKSIRQLTLTNDYATTKTAVEGQEETNPDHIAQFLSVATGYHQDTKGNLAPFRIQANSGMEPGDTRATVTLSRLATKIDIQWDAADAADIQEVRVERVNINSQATNPTPTDAGAGRLFPKLATQNDPALIGSKQFINTSPVSQRNGRVYHYVFPDGVTTPVINFGLKGKKKGGSSGTAEEITKSFLIPLEEASLIPAAWYKVNVTIRGLDNQSNVTVKIPNTHNIVTE